MGIEMTIDYGSVPFYGMYRGIVVNNADPLGLMRITATCPQVFGDGTVSTGWAWPCFPPGWGEVISLFQWAQSLPVLTPPYEGPSPTGVPETGAGVYLSFLGGDVNNPIWHGVWQIGS